MFELVNVLLVEGDALLGNKLQLKLKGDRFNSRWVGSLAAANELRQQESYDIFIISSVLPDGSGQTLIHELGKSKFPPIRIALLESNSTSKIVEAFKFGADDVLSRPVQYPELLARMQAILRRAKPIEKSLIRHQDICVDLDGQMVTRNGEIVNLSAKEFTILKILIKNSGLIFSKQQLEDKVYKWGEDIGSNALEVHISHLRKKLGKSLITTFRNMGYVIKSTMTLKPFLPKKIKLLLKKSLCGQACFIFSSDSSMAITVSMVSLANRINPRLIASINTSDSFK